MPDIAYIAYHNRLHAMCVERGDQSGCALVLDIFDLMFDLLELPLLGADQFLPASRALLHPPIDAAMQFGLEFVALRRFGIRLAQLFALAPAFESCKERLHARIAGMGMQLVGGEHAHQMFRLEPHAFVPHSTPEEDHRLALEVAARAGSLIELCVLANGDTAYLLHPTSLSEPHYTAESFLCSQCQQCSQSNSSSRVREVCSYLRETLCAEKRT